MADIHSSAFSQTDSENSTGTLPSYAEGQQPSQTNDSSRAFMGAVRRFADHIQPTVTSTGVVGALVVTYIVPPTELTTGLRFAFLMGADLGNTGPCTLDVGLGPLPIYLDGVDLTGGELLENNTVEVCYRGGDTPYWELLSTRASISLSRLPPGADPSIYTTAPRLVLRGDTTYYVNSATGNDLTGWGGNGGGEFQTLQGCYDFLLENVDGAGNDIEIYFSGTDSAGLVIDLPIVGVDACILTLNGNIVTGNPYGVAAFHGGCKVQIQGGGSITAGQYCVVASEGSNVAFSQVKLYHCGNVHLYAQNAASLLIQGDYEILSGSNIHWGADSAGSITVYPSANVTTTGTPGFSSCFALASTGGIIQCQNAAFFGSGATGIRYNTSTGGGIYTSSGGADFLPGDTPGTSDATTMGWYQ